MIARRLPNLLTALSLLLCAAALVGWVQSYRVGYMLLRGGEGTTLEVALGGGRLSLSYGTHTPGLFDQPRAPGWRLLEWFPQYSAPSSFPSALGFAWATRHPSPSVHTFLHLGVPMWFVTLSAAICPVLRARAARAERRREARTRRGQCPRCGYDLRATPGRCPECGRAATPSAESARAARSG